MDHLPIPRLRAAWISSIILTAILFIGYYTVFYPNVLSTYSKQFQDVTYLSPDDEYSSLKQLKIIGHIPKYTYGVEPIYFFVTVQNLGNLTFLDTKLDLVVSLSPSTLLLPSTYHDDIYKASIEFKEIGPGAIVIGRIPLVAQDGVKVESIWINTTIKGEKFPATPSRRVSRPTTPEMSPLRALQHSFIEYILLPPWSNGLIFALVLFSSYLSQDKKYGKDEDDELNILETWNDWLSSIGQHFKRAIFILYIFISFLLIISFSWKGIIIDACSFALVMILLIISERNWLKERVKILIEKRHGRTENTKKDENLFFTSQQSSPIPSSSFAHRTFHEKSVPRYRSSPPLRKRPPRGS